MVIRIARTHWDPGTTSAAALTRGLVLLASQASCRSTHPLRGLGKAATMVAKRSRGRRDAGGRAALLGAALCLSAFLGVALTPQAARAELSITGSDADVQALKDMIKDCRGKSKSFDAFIADIDPQTDAEKAAKKKKPPERCFVKISVGRKGAYVDDATGGQGHTTVNLNNVEKFPNPEKDDKTGKLKMPAGVPPWATTRCESIAHWMREAYSTSMTQSTTIGMGHSAGIALQNAVRKDFGQQKMCTGSYNHYSDKPKDDNTHSTAGGGFLYTEISYASDKATTEGPSGSNEKLTFDGDNMTITYYKDDNNKYEPPKADKDLKSTQDGRISLTPGADVAKQSVLVVNPGGQRVAGGTISIVPQNPQQAMVVAPLSNGTAAVPSHGPEDVVIITAHGHEPVTMRGKELDGNSGVRVGTPPKPLTLLIFGGTQPPAITEPLVKLALKGQYGLNLAPTQHMKVETIDETIGLSPNLQHMVLVKVDPYASPDFRMKVGTLTETIEVSTEVPLLGGEEGLVPYPPITPITLQPPSGPTVYLPVEPQPESEFKINRQPAVLLDLPPPLDRRLFTADTVPIAVEPTPLPGGLVAEGDQPCEIEGPRPAAPFATSKGSWQQSYPDQWWLGAIDWLKPDGSSTLPDRGRPVIVAVIDTGVDLGHPDLAGAAWINSAPGKGGYADDVNGWNFVAENADLRDRNGHGTVVAGIIAANPGKSFGIAGINPWARIMALKAMEIDGKGGSIAVTRAIVYAVKHGARVINLSVGGKHISYAEQKALDYAAQKGVVVVVASGNQGENTAGYSPAGLRGALTVAAIGPDLLRQTFSNWGANVALAAPGVDILSLRARQTDLLLFTRKDYKPGTGVVAQSYYRVTGSSFAAPMVSGAASLLLSARPQLSGPEVTRLLEQSARDVGGIGKDQFIGYGLIDIDAALKADPSVFVEAAIASVAAVTRDGRTLVRVTGTASADRLQEAYIEIGQGDTPTSWKRVSRSIQAPVVDGVLDELDPSIFGGAKVWMLRAVAVHQNGNRREARFKLTLG